MGKAELNTEIVLMRHVVRKARVRVIHKLIREIKLLRKRHGDDTQREKFTKKVDKLVEEMLALKKAKDDDISKFGILNKRSLQEILMDTSSDATIHVFAKVAFHKILKDKIDALRNKFPDYENYLGPGKKKAKGSKKANKKDKASTKSSNTSDKSNNSDLSQNGNVSADSSEDVQNDNDSDMETEEIEENNESYSILEDDNSVSNDLEPGSILRIKPSNSEFEEEQNDSEEKINKSSVKKKEKKLIKNDQISQTSDPKVSKKDDNLLKTEKAKAVKVVSKEATVKRFTEILQEEETNENAKSSQSGIEINKNSTENLEKEVDDFFMTGDGSNAYLSVSVPKSKEDENDLPEADANPDNVSKQQRNSRKFDERFFSKVGKSSGFMDKRNGKVDRYQHGKEGKNQTPFERTTKRPDFPKKNAKQSNSKNALNDEKLHPSWAAKKKQQEMIKQGFQGKKIVFNDD